MASIYTQRWLPFAIVLAAGTALVGVLQRTGHAPTARAAGTLVLAFVLSPLLALWNGLAPGSGPLGMGLWVGTLLAIVGAASLLARALAQALGGAPGRASNGAAASSAAAPRRP